MPSFQHQTGHHVKAAKRFLEVHPPKTATKAVSMSLFDRSYGAKTRTLPEDFRIMQKEKT
jgi:hypothetical protein